MGADWGRAEAFKESEERKGHSAPWGEPVLTERTRREQMALIKGTGGSRTAGAWFARHFRGRLWKSQRIGVCNSQCNSQWADLGRGPYRPDPVCGPWDISSHIRNTSFLLGPALGAPEKACWEHRHLWHKWSPSGGTLHSEPPLLPFQETGHKAIRPEGNDLSCSFNSFSRTLRPEPSPE